LAEQLLETLDLYSELRLAAQTYDKRIMPLSVLLPETGIDVSSKKTKVAEGSTGYLWLILILILVMERLLARYKKQ